MRTAWLEELAARRRFGMKPGLGRIARLDAALGSPSRRLGRVIHVAGTNGKGATAAILDAALAAMGARVARYTSPHLVRINERFSLGGAPLGDDVLEAASAHVASVVADDPELAELTFFEALTAVAFVAFAEAAPDWTILETGLGGRLDATNVCQPVLSVITRIGLDHCDWLGDTVEKIAAEKAGIVKPGVPVVLGRNEPSVRAVIADVARRQGAPLVFAPEAADESEIPADFSLAGAFNRENAVTALAALKVLTRWDIASPETRSLSASAFKKGLSRVIWPGRFQRVQDVLIDGAHNPPAARALAAALAETPEIRAGRRFALVAGFCGDKDVATVLATLAPCVSRGFAVRTSNPRSLAADDTAARMRAAGIAAEPAEDLSHALASARASGDPVLVAGSLFLAGEALQLLGALPGAAGSADPSCLLRVPPERGGRDGQLDKSEIRKAMRTRRKALSPEERAQAARVVCGKIVAGELSGAAVGPSGNGSVYAVYLASPDEIDLSAAIEVLLARGATVVAPRWDGRAYELARLKSLREADLRTGPMGILEPKDAAIVSPKLVGVWLIPGLAFTRDGKRLGYGGGWYDRLLAEANPQAKKFGIAHSFQVVDDLPSEPHDILIDAVIC